MKALKTVKEAHKKNASQSSYQNTSHTSQNGTSSLAGQLINRLSKIEAEEVDHLSNYFEDRIQIQKESIDKWFALQGDLYNSFTKYKNDIFHSEKEKADNNLESLLSNLQGENLFQENYTLDVEKKLNPEQAKALSQQPWFDGFMKAQTAKFIQNLHSLAKKMVEVRLPNTIQEKRKTIVAAIENCLKVIDKSNTSDGVDPYIKHNLGEVYKQINELQAYDNIIPQIIKDLSEKPEEYARELSPMVQEFLVKLELLNKDIDQNLYKDASNKQLYEKIDKDEPNKIRVSRYGIEVTSGMLVSLKPAKGLQASVVAFYINYLNEKIEATNKTLADGEKIQLASEPIDIYGGEEILYQVLGRDRNFKGVYKRIGFVFHIDQTHYILVELYDSNGKGAYELVIYDSNLKEYEHCHTRLKALFAEIVGEDELGRTTSKFGGAGAGGTREKFGSTMTKAYTAGLDRSLPTRIANCPQQMNGYDSGVFVLKNAALLSENRKVMQGTYSQKEIDMFRYEIFNSIIKMSRTDDINFAYTTSNVPAPPLYGNYTSSLPQTSPLNLTTSANVPSYGHSTGLGYQTPLQRDLASTYVANQWLTYQPRE
jgi:hypothetical protein